MRAALPCVFLAVLISPWAVAQQEPPKPPTATTPAQPVEAKLPETKLPETKLPETKLPETKLPEAKLPETKPADAQPPEVKPPEPKAPEPKPKPAENGPNVDPARMAIPKAGDAKNPGGPMDDNAYILGAEDQIGVLVNNSTEFNGTHLIRPDGRITVNLVGEVMAAGLTPEGLTDVLREKIKKYVVDPDVTISVLGVNSKRFFIQGEVNRPGEVKLVVPTKVLEALVNAGGFRDFAKKKDIVIIREEGTATKRLHFNYNDVIKGKHLEQNIFLKAGDIIVVR